MARYIDADALIRNIYPLGIGDGMYVINAKAVKFAIDNTPTADVAPRAEVAREIFKAIEKTVNDCVVAESLFKPAYFEFRKFNEHLAELKKKYTGESQ